MYLYIFIFGDKTNKKKINYFTYLMNKKIVMEKLSYLIFFPPTYLIFSRTPGEQGKR